MNNGICVYFNYDGLYVHKKVASELNLAHNQSIDEETFYEVIIRNAQTIIDDC